MRGLALLLAMFTLSGWRAVPVGVQTSAAKKGPVIADFGPVYEVPAPDFETPVDHDYRVVFDVAAAPAEPDQLAPSIETVARFLNMHARAGVPPGRLQAAIVLHGGAAKYALEQEAYQKRFDTANPNLALLSALDAAGVRVILCGQSAASRGFGRDELAVPVELALSAMTALIVLQKDGYQLIAF